MTVEPAHLPTIILKPGELYTAERPLLVSTVLGSCISVTLFNPRFELAAICHAVLPTGTKQSPDESFRYVDRCIVAMLNFFESRGVGREELEAKLFGGSDMLSPLNSSRKSVGQQNIEMALRVLEAERLRLVASDLGGNLGRKLYFKTHTGEVFLERIRSRSLSLNDPAANFETDLGP